MLRRILFTIVLGLSVATQAAPTAVDLTSGTTGTVFPNQSFSAETRAAEVIIDSGDFAVESMTLNHFTISVSGTVGARIYDGSGTLIASANAVVASGADQSVTIQVFVTLAANQSYWIAFYVSTGGTGHVIDPTPAGLAVTPYAPTAGYFTVTGSGSAPGDAFPSPVNSFIPLNMTVTGVPSLTAPVVTNVAETASLGFPSNGQRAHAGSFLTSGGATFSLDSVQVMMLSVSQATTGLRLRADAGGQPGALLADLGSIVVPVGATLVTYGATGTLLLPNTIYWVTLGETGSGTNTQWLGTTSSAQSSPVGWTIGDQTVYSDDGGASWQQVVVGQPNASPLFTINASTGPDGDGDGRPDSVDNCTTVPNGPLQLDVGSHSQLDTNGDGYGNICDADLNNSGLTTSTDFNLLRSVLNQSSGSSALAAAADINGSGLVTSTDFNLLRARLNTAPGPSGLSCAGTVPCPVP